MNDELASVLERAALATLACHETAYHGAVRAAVALRGYSVSRLREVLKRTQDVLLADGPDADARRAAATLVQRVVTVPMMARAAITGDVTFRHPCSRSRSGSSNVSAQRQGWRASTKSSSSRCTRRSGGAWGQTTSRSPRAPAEARRRGARQ